VPVNYLRGKTSVIWFSHDWTDALIPLGPLTIGKLRFERMFQRPDDLLGLSVSKEEPTKELR